MDVTQCTQFTIQIIFNLWPVGHMLPRCKPQSGPVRGPKKKRQGERHVLKKNKIIGEPIKIPTVEQTMK